MLQLKFPWRHQDRIEMKYPQTKPQYTELTKEGNPNWFHNSRNVSQNKEIKQGQRIGRRDLGEICLRQAVSSCLVSSAPGETCRACYLLILFCKKEPQECLPENLLCVPHSWEDSGPGSYSTGKHSSGLRQQNRMGRTV